MRLLLVVQSSSQVNPAITRISPIDHLFQVKRFLSMLLLVGWELLLFNWLNVRL